MTIGRRPLLSRLPKEEEAKTDMLTFWLPPKVSRNVRDTLEPLSATRSPYSTKYVTLDGPLTDVKLILLQVLQIPSVDVVGQVQLAIGYIPTSSDASL